MIAAGRKALLLGPVAIHPTRQGEGLGGLLIRESLAEARRQGWERVMLVGDAPYYGRFGFRKLPHIVMPRRPTRTACWAGIAARRVDGGDGDGREDHLSLRAGPAGPYSVA